MRGEVVGGGFVDVGIRGPGLVWTGGSVGELVAGHSEGELEGMTREGRFSEERG